MNGCIADAGDGSKDTCPIDLLLRLLTMCRTFGNELQQIDLSCSDITLDGWNDCRRDQIGKDELPLAPFLWLLKNKYLFVTVSICIWKNNDDEICVPYICK